MAVMRVVICDRDVWVRLGVRAVLTRHHGASIVGETADGASVMYMVARLTPSLVILDTELQRMSGLDVVTRLRSQPSAPPVLVWTDQSSERTLRAAFDAGATGDVLKQSPAASLVHAAATVESGSAYVDPGVQMFRVSRDPGGEWLSERQRRVVTLVAAGYSNKEIAAMLGVSLKTAETDRARAVSKLGTRERTDWLRHALEQGWFQQYVRSM